MRAYLSSLLRYWRRHLGVGTALFFVVLFWSYAIQSPQYRVEGLVEVGRTPVQAEGEIGIEMVMSIEATKDLVKHLSPVNVSNNPKGLDGDVEHLGVRINSNGNLVVKRQEVVS